MSAGRLLGGRYQVGELLGYGGMAEVHRGRDLRLGRDVAIKMLRPDLARDENFQLRFRREAQNSASLNHPAIVAVYDTGEEHGANGETLPYIVMEFVNGRTLKEVLAAEGRLMPRRALEITADICAALEFSHRHGIIHRDVKPGNVMLTQTGQVKVMDFGIARAMASGASTMTQTSAVIGTAQYLSPEQARGETVDARSDVYATGCVLYELLTGNPPFVGDNPVSVAYQHVREDPVPPSHSNRDVSPAVDAVVLKALAKNRMNRYQSAGEMRGDLLRAAAGRQVLATPVLPDSETVQLVPPPPRVIGNRNTGTFAQVGGGPPRRRASTWVLVALSLLGVLAVAALGTGIWLANRTPMVTVPQLIGKTQAEANQALNNANLVGAPSQKSGCQQTGKVVDQDPPAQQSVKQGTPVTFHVCTGPGTVTVPNVLNLSEADATAQLKQAGLNVTTDHVDSVKPENTVDSTEPPADTSVAAGSTVTLHLSLHNEGQVPDVRDLSLGDARTKLGNAGFTNVVTATKFVSDPALDGVARSTDPPAGVVRKFTDKITIFVGQFVQNSPSPQPAPSPSSPAPG
ncbi:MAG: Stk1 family PASTA domain-containing Ser/Thr kinase [Micromonosporaceae bacterium]|nr:Stk1 family PASTA domain-containing Ser/Thr kinase [Micromonosporaceae bacterium]